MDPHDEEQRSEEGDVHGQQPDARRGQQAEGGEGREHQREEGWVDVGDHPRLGPPGVLEVGVDVRAVRGGLGAAEIVDEIEAQALRRQGQPLDDRPREVIGADAEHEHEQYPIAKRWLVQAPDAVPASHAARACTAISSGLRIITRRCQASRSNAIGIAVKPLKKKTCQPTKYAKGMMAKAQMVASVVASPQPRWSAATRTASTGSSRMASKEWT